MYFNSLNFFIFLSGVGLLYYLLPHRWQNRILLIASYFFYGCWDWRFLSLILISTTTDYFCGIKIHNQSNQEDKKRYLYISIGINLIILGFFKYWNFFAESFTGLLSSLGFGTNIPLLQVFLPLGISFYTFKTMSYSIDVFRRRIVPTYNFTDYALFVAFFPELTAGPIDQAKTLLPQISSERKFDRGQILAGLQLMLWGLFKKVFVADNLATLVGQIYGNPASTGMEYVVATWGFAFQIYADFSGYSDLAIGAGKCLGFKLTQNFALPYVAVNPSDFWRRWHISLSQWLREYLYIPLGGNKGGKWKTYRNLFLTMLLCGLWHGAAWNYVIWGGYHGILLCTHRLAIASKRKVEQIPISPVRHIGQIFITFQMVCLGWVFFRAQSLNEIKMVFISIFHPAMGSLEWLNILSKVFFFSGLLILEAVWGLVKELGISSGFARNFQAVAKFSHFPPLIKSAEYAVLIYLICCHGVRTQSFIYSQF